MFIETHCTFVSMVDARLQKCEPWLVTYAPQRNVHCHSCTREGWKGGLLRVARDGEKVERRGRRPARYGVIFVREGSLAERQMGCH